MTLCTIPQNAETNTVAKSLPANCQNPTNRLYLRLLHFRVRFRQNPDEFVKYGKYEMRRRDMMQVEAGFTTLAVIRLESGELAGASLWKERPEETGYNVSWDDPRIASEQRERERELERERQRQQPEPPKPQAQEVPFTSMTKEQLQKAHQELKERLLSRRTYSYPKITPNKGTKKGRRM